jgi:hypothetical protein
MKTLTKPAPQAKPELSPLQIEAITEFDALLHPTALVSFVQSSSRDQWRKIADYMDALKLLLPNAKEKSAPEVVG